jgi:2-hydroxychromene-2-carboxylate isomerase
MAEVERRAAAYGLPPFVWPDPFPANTLTAMRVAAFAKQTGRAVSFSLAAFRQAFAAGRDLTDPDNVVIAGAACELHPRALLKAVETEIVKSALREATDGAAAQGVEGVPAVVVGGEVFWGDDRLEEAVEAAARLS